MDSSTATLKTVLQGLFVLLPAWGNALLAMTAVLGVALASSAGVGLWTAVNASDGHHDSPVGVGGKLAAVVIGSLISVASIIVGAASFWFAPP